MLVGFSIWEGEGRDVPKSFSRVSKRDCKLPSMVNGRGCEELSRVKFLLGRGGGVQKGLVVRVEMGWNLLSLENFEIVPKFCCEVFFPEAE